MHHIFPLPVDLVAHSYRDFRARERLCWRLILPGLPAHKLVLQVGLYIFLKPILFKDLLARIYNGLILSIVITVLNKDAKIAV